MATFFLAMTMYPEIQRKAQEELDRIVGTDRLPEFSDEPSLPYTSAVMKEVLRWQQVAPFGQSTNACMRCSILMICVNSNPPPRHG